MTCRELLDVRPRSVRAEESARCAVRDVGMPGRHRRRAGPDVLHGMLPLAFWEPLRWMTESSTSTWCSRCSPIERPGWGDWLLQHPASYRTVRGGRMAEATAADL